MSDSPEAVGAKATIRWVGALTTLLSAAASVGFLLEGYPVGAPLTTAAMAVLFGVITWREWRRR